MTELFKYVPTSWLTVVFTSCLALLGSSFYFGSKSAAVETEIVGIKSNLNDAGLLRMRMADRINSIDSKVSDRLNNIDSRLSQIEGKLEIILRRVK